MSRPYSTTYETQWEVSENGWHAVVALCTKGYQWTAYIEYANSPHWRVWAGCMFPNIQQAQEWCKAEIVHQIRSTYDDASLHEGEKNNETGAWHWLWSKLSDELGHTQAAAIRDEMNRRLGGEGHDYEGIQQMRFVGQNLA